jgi:hypothetical protein
MLILWRALTIFIIQPEEKVKTIGNTNDNNEINVIKNEQTQPSLTNSSDEHVNKLIDDKMKIMQDAFQLKLGLIENEKNAALSHLQQEQITQRRIGKIESRIKTGY